MFRSFCSLETNQEIVDDTQEIVDEFAFLLHKITQIFLKNMDLNNHP